MYLDVISTSSLYITLQTRMQSLLNISIYLSSFLTYVATKASLLLQLEGQLHFFKHTDKTKQKYIFMLKTYRLGTISRRLDEPNNPHLGGASKWRHLCYMNENSDLTAEANSVCEHSCPHQEGSFISK